MPRNVFVDPLNGHRYDWHVNHNEEGDSGVSRSVEVLGRTGGGYVLQQGADGPLKLSLSGTILHASQLAEFNYFNAACKTRTIFFTDFAGDSFEVLITDFKPRRQRTARNPRDPSIPYHYWSYTMELTVLRARAGTWVGVIG